MPNSPWIITVEELQKQFDSVVIVDVREQEEHDEAKIENSKLIPLAEIQARAPKELDPKSDIVLYCAAGIRSMQALMALKMLGFEKLRSLEGGIYAWQDRVSSTKS
jgi:adenylyltransferase/sulfurtransferase